MRRERAAWTSPWTSPWIEIVFGSGVEAPSGRLGWSTGAVVSLHTREVTHLLVQRAFLGLLPGRTIAVPTAWIQQRHRDRLSCVRDVGASRSRQVSGGHSIEGTGPVVQASQRDVALAESLGGFLAVMGERGAERGFTAIDRGTEVYAVARRIGRVERVLLHPKTKHITHVVIRSHPLSLRVAALPIDWIRKMGRKRLYLDTRLEQMSELPGYPPRTDPDLEERIVDALATHAPTGLGNIRVRVVDRMVELSGLVRTAPMRQVAEQVARRASGGLPIANRLEIDDEIVRRIMLTLNRQCAMAAVHVRVSSLLGAVRLEGTVSTPEVRQQVEDIAAHEAPPAVSVYNLLEVELPEELPEDAVMFGLSG